MREKNEIKLKLVYEHIKIEVDRVEDTQLAVTLIITSFILVIS